MTYVDPSLFVVPENIAVTGRIKSWLEDVKAYQESTTPFQRFQNRLFKTNKLKRLPVSCTVYVVDDNMDETLASIEQSWLFTSHGLRNAAGVAIHLSNIRPEGAESSHGLVASGPCSFAQIYSKLNEILRRGGVYKNGAINLHLDYDHPDIVKFATMSRAELPWARRTINVDEGFLDHPHLDTLLRSVEKGDCFLVKKQFDRQGNRLYHNVCLEILLPHTGTCLLAHVNLGKLSVGDGSILKAFTEGMDWLCKIHKVTGVGDSGYYLSPNKDKQVGLGVLGLANLLAIEGIKYSDLVYAMEEVYNLETTKYKVVGLNWESKEFVLAKELMEAYKAAAKIAKSYGMERCFTVAPTASCSFNHKDRELFTTTPEIAPPVATSIERDSQTMGVLEVDYNPACEIAEEVGWDVYFRLNCVWQSYMNITGLAHAISTNWWSDKVILNKSFIKVWLLSPLKSLYYAWQVTPYLQDKSEVLTVESILSSSDFEDNSDEVECLPCKQAQNSLTADAYNTECLACSE